MTRLNRDIRVRIGKLKAGSLGSTGTELTFSTTASDVRVGQVDSWGGQKVRPTEGRTESETWTVTLVESSTGEEITQHLGTTDGRPDLLRRLVDTSVKPTTNGTWSSSHVQATGRLKDVILDENVGAWRFIALDEQLKIRQTEAFVGVSSTADPTSTTGTDILHGTTTTQILPMGRRVDYDGRGTQRKITATVTETANDLALLEQTDSRKFFVTRAVQQVIEDDRKEGSDPVRGTPGSSDVGEYKTLVADVDGTLRPVGDIDFNKPDAEGPPDGSRVPNRITVIWPSSVQPSTGTSVNLSLFMPQRAPDRDVPLHIGGTGTHPAQLARDLITAADARIDSTQFDALVADRRFPDVTFRITDSANLDEWLQENIWRPFNLAPTANRKGEISPRRMTLPGATGADAVPDITQLTQIGTSTIREDPPTWEHVSNEQITEIQYEWEAYTDFMAIDPGPASEDPLEDMDGDTPADLLSASQRKPAPREHDKITEFGAQTAKVKLAGLHEPSVVERVVDVYANETFARYGDGPVRTKVGGMSALESVDIGKYVLIDAVPTYPNLAASTGAPSRGGTRLLQVVNKRYTVRGPEFELLDAGSTSQPLQKPTVSVSPGADRPRHVIDVTVTDLTDGARAIVQRNESATSPDSTDAGWTEAVTATSTDAISDEGLPGGTKFFYRARQIKAGRIGSLWSDYASTATDALPSPSNLSASSITGCKFTLNWTVGSTDYPVRVAVDSDDNVASLEENTESFRVHDGLTDQISVDSSHTAKVLHFDGFGGKSAAASTTVVTASTNDVCEPLVSVGVLVGKNTDLRAST